jgi:hypothetical protein
LSGAGGKGVISKNVIILTVISNFLFFKIVPKNTKKYKNSSKTTAANIYALGLGSKNTQHLQRGPKTYSAQEHAHQKMQYTPKNK